MLENPGSLAQVTLQKMSIYYEHSVDYVVTMYICGQSAGKTTLL